MNWLQLGRDCIWAGYSGTKSWNWTGYIETERRTSYSGTEMDRDRLVII